MQLVAVYRKIRYQTVMKTLKRVFRKTWCISPLYLIPDRTDVQWPKSWFSMTFNEKIIVFSNSRLLPAFRKQFKNWIIDNICCNWKFSQKKRFLYSNVFRVMFLNCKTLILSHSNTILALIFLLEKHWRIYESKYLDTLTLCILKILKKMM